MPTFGGFGGWPRRFGGGVSRVKVIYDALNQARGTAYDTSDESNVTAETYAEAVALAAAWAGNRRMAHVTDPRRMPVEMIPRWEAILDLHPAVTDSINDRRSDIAAKFLAWVGPDVLDDVVSAIAGDSLIGIERTLLADAVPRWPANGYPDSWTSNCAHVVVRVSFGANQTMSEFWDMRRHLTQTLDDYLPSWTTFDIATFRPNGVSNGFFLDERNLNYETFRI